MGASFPIVPSMGMIIISILSQAGREEKTRPPLISSWGADTTEVGIELEGDGRKAGRLFILQMTIVDKPLGEISA
jgi:hypothetical protein